MNRSERSSAAYESTVKSCVETARKFGNHSVTEEQVRREVRQIVEHADRKLSDGGYKSPPRVNTHAWNGQTDHVHYDEKDLG